MKNSFLLTLMLTTSLSISLVSQSWRDSIKQFESDTSALKYLAEQLRSTIHPNLEISKDLYVLYDSIALFAQIPKHLGNSKILKGNIYYTKGNHDEALPYYIDAVKILEGTNENELLALAFNNLGTCYEVRNDTETSTSYFKKSLTIYEDIQDTLWVANVNSNLGLQYLNDGHLEEAELHLNQAVTSYDQINNSIFKGIALLNRGNLRIEQKKYSLAIKDYTVSQELVPESMSPLLAAAAQAGIGAAYNRSGSHQRALPFLQRSLDMAHIIDHKGQIQESNRELADVYKSIGHYKQALVHYQKYSETKDSVFTTEQDAKMVDALTKYESEKKESEIILLNSQSEIQLTRLNARKNQVLILGIGSILLLGLLAMLYSFYDKIKNQNGIIASALEEKDTLLREIHHRVKNNLQVISALLTLQSKHVKDDIAFEALQEGQGRVQSMALIHQDLYQHDNLNGVDTKDYFEKLIENLIETYKTDDRNIELHCDIQSMILDVDTMIPLGLVVNELTSNALKHAFSEDTTGNITITIIEENNQLHLSVKDDGKGTEIFHLENKSFGFSLIRSFARRLDAELNIENKHGLNVELLINNYHKVA